LFSKISNTPNYLPKFVLLKFVLIATTVLLTATACDSDQQMVESDSVEGIGLPQRIRQSFAIDFSQVTAILNFNGQDYEMARRGDRYQVDVPNVVVGSDVNVNVTYYERLPNGYNLLLATTEQIQVNVTNATLPIREDQYNYNHDDDGDSVSNIIEREQGLNPLVPENTANRNVVLQFNIPTVVNNSAITRAIVLVADVPRAFSRDGNRINVSTVVPSQPEATIDIRLIQIYTQPNGETVDVTIARAQQQTDAGTDDFFVTLTDADFNLAIDSDGDGVSNLDELQSGTNPILAE